MGSGCPPPSFEGCDLCRARSGLRRPADHPFGHLTAATAMSFTHSYRIARCRKAFTLIEIMLAVAIFAIVLVAINSVFYSALRLRRKASEAIEQSLPIQQTIAIMKRDLQGLVAPGGTLTGPL